MSDPITRLNAAREGRYRVERELGEGGTATVYLADDLKHERKCRKPGRVAASEESSDLGPRRLFWTIA